MKMSDALEIDIDSSVDDNVLKEFGMTRVAEIKVDSTFKSLPKVSHFATGGIHLNKL